jgi:D-tagatose-1,6-bisphosphate aldolase subunit GatZ/KbaZ
MRDILFDLRSDHLTGRRGGMVSICSARREVLESALESAMLRGDLLLVEATANQINQFGGYSGMTPAAFAANMDHLAHDMGFPRSRIWLGADHLGPYTWRNEPAEHAMVKALELVQQCVAAGFRKIHIDTGFGCTDDPQPELPLETAADRAVSLCRAAESAAERIPDKIPRPLYVIGAEVPPPGGALDAADALHVTPVEKVEEVLQLYQARFRVARLERAWDRVIAVVVQPGVEFGDYAVAHYCSQKAHALSSFYEQLPGRMTYEVHSTDYQSAGSLTQMVADHFILLKVGPCLTDAFREAVFGLARIESERLRPHRVVQASDIREVLESVMLQNPIYWHSHYRGTEQELRFLRSHSKRDRIRYYWSHPAVERALHLLMANLSAGLWPAEIEAHLPELSASMPADQVSLDPALLIRRRIQLALDPYFKACE